MRSFIRLALFLGLCCPIIAGAQLTLQGTDLPVNPGTVIDYEFSGIMNPIPVDPGPAGPNQIWDFTSMSVSNSEQNIWVDPATTPLYSLYPNANRCYTVDYLTYGYFGITPSGWSWYGYDSTVFHDATPLYALPCTYGDTWTTTWWYSPGAQTTVEDSLVYEVDGWGTLIDEMGSSPCLRLKCHWTSTISSPWFPGVMTTWGYNWIVPGLGSVVGIESTIDETNPNFTEGFFRRMVNINTGVRTLPAESSLPNQVTLSPAFPNPFNPTTQISFSLPKPGEVSLVVFDQLGRQVAQLAQGRFAAGQYQATFDGALLPSGLYLAKLQVEGAVNVQKLVLMK